MSYASKSNAVLLREIGDRIDVLIHRGSNVMGLYAQLENSDPNFIGLQEVTDVLREVEYRLARIDPPPARPRERQLLEPLPANWTSCDVNFLRPIIRNAVKIITGRPNPIYK